MLKYCFVRSFNSRFNFNRPSDYIAGHMVTFRHKLLRTRARGVGVDLISSDRMTKVCDNPPDTPCYRGEIRTLLWMHYADKVWVESTLQGTLSLDDNDPCSIDMFCVDV